MKIVYVFRSLAIWGGIERVIIDKANRLANLGYDVSILTMDQGSHPIPYRVDSSVHIEDLNIRYHQQYYYKGLRRLWMRWRLQRLLVKCLRCRVEQLRPDVVVTVATDYAEFVISAVGNKSAVVVESHSIYRQTFTQQHHLICCYRDWFKRRSLSVARMIVALTEADAAEWRRHYPNVQYIPNIVNFNSNGRVGCYDMHRVIFVGRFDSQKRPELAIAIWQRVQPLYPDWELHIYGEGDRRESVVEAASHAEGVVVHEPTSTIFEAYCNSAFLILTSLYEPFGLVMPEAMSCGLPIVAFDCPYGPRAIVTDGVDGFLVREGDEQEFADRMAQLMSDSDLCNRMGTAAIQVSQRYGASQIMPLWQQLFDGFSSTSDSNL